MFCVAGLKDYQDLAKNIYHSLRAVLPVCVRDQIANLPTLKTRLPSRTTIFRYQLVIDVAFTRHLREQPLEPVCYWNLDSSPQGGRDWLWCQRSNVHQDLLLGALEAVNTLCSNPLESHGISMQRREELTQAIKSALNESHVFVLLNYSRDFNGHWLLQGSNFTRHVASLRSQSAQ